MRLFQLGNLELCVAQQLITELYQLHTFFETRCRFSQSQTASLKLSGHLIQAMERLLKAGRSSAFFGRRILGFGHATASCGATSLRGTSMPVGSLIRKVPTLQKRGHSRGLNWLGFGFSPRFPCLRFGSVRLLRFNRRRRTCYCRNRPVNYGNLDGVSFKDLVRTGHYFA